MAFWNFATRTVLTCGVQCTRAHGNILITQSLRRPSWSMRECGSFGWMVYIQKSLVRLSYVMQIASGQYTRTDDSY
jgi:hypothetical protein